MTTNTILLVEDEPEIREMLCFALGRAGYHVTEAETGEQALQQLDGPLPDHRLDAPGHQRHRAGAYATARRADCGSAVDHVDRAGRRVGQAEKFRFRHR
ncbi:MAG: response regulator [Gammaproteobacteria bacterium]|nr:MAG: response regulator [Gammaproteobacteria bacterium]